MTRTEIPNSMIYVVGEVLGSWYMSHSKLDTLFGGNGFPGDPPPGNCIQKCQAWFRRANDTADADPIALLGSVLVEFMNLNQLEDPRWNERFRRINEALAKNGLTIDINGNIAARTSVPLPDAAPEKSKTVSIDRSNTFPFQNEAPPVGANSNGSPIIVLVTVNDNETHALLDAFVGVGQIPKQLTKGGVTYNNLGHHGGCLVVHTVCEMGAGGVGSSQQRTREAIEHWHPKAIIAVGIAFGVDENTQAIGNVLVSTQIQDYELGRLNENGTLTPRGDKPSCADALRNRFRQIDTAEFRRNTDWPKVRFGLILSGQKLVDNLDYRASLKALFTEAIGGEMEGTGVYVSANSAKIDWIVVKGICDWGHNKNQNEKDEWQKLAAKNAARVVKTAIDAGGLYVDTLIPPTTSSAVLMHNQPGMRTTIPIPSALDFEFANNIDCYSDDDGPRGDGLNPTGTYARLLIKNSSNVDIVGVQAFLRSVEKDGVDHIQNRRPLLFSPYRPGDALEKTIKPYASELVDILRIDVVKNQIHVPTKGSFVRVLDSSGNDIFQTAGLAILTIEVAASGIKMQTLKLNFEWRCQRHNPAPALSIKSNQ